MIMKQIFTARIAALAWKNIWRNKVRSGVILSAIAIGLFSGTFMMAFMSGWIHDTVTGDIETQFSHVQIHDKHFIANNDINACFMRDDVEAKIKQSGLPATTAFRLVLTGMLASPHNAIGVTAKGVWTDEEKQVTTVWEHISDTLGAYLPEDTRLGIVISKKIAEKLKVRLNQKIVFTFQDTQGDMQNIAFRVCGIYKTTNGMFDEANVFMRYEDLFEYTGLPAGAVHEAGILFPDLETCQTTAPQLKNMFPDMDARDWRELNPALAMMEAFADMWGFIMLVIFMLALSFGIINTMLMSVLERTRELGMLGAIGMGKGKIFQMIMLETVFLTFLGSIIGIILGIGVLLPLMKTGIDLSIFIEDQFEDWGFSSFVNPVLTAKMLVETIVLVVLAGLLSALYPARKALKLKPLDAIRQDN